MSTPRPSGPAGKKGNVPVKSPQFPDERDPGDRDYDLAGCMFEGMALTFILALVALVFVYIYQAMEYYGG